MIQALRNLGPENVCPGRLQSLRRALPAAERRVLLDDLALAPAWMHPRVRFIAAG